MTDTPETDAATFHPDGDGGCVDSDLSRKLERERDDAREKCDKLAEALIELRDAEWLTLPGRANDIVESALATLNQQEP